MNGQEKMRHNFVFGSPNLHPAPINNDRWFMRLQAEENRREAARRDFDRLTRLSSQEELCALALALTASNAAENRGEQRNETEN